MDKVQAIISFWETITNLPVYDENSVPDDARMPYLTCEVKTSSFENETPITANLWYRDTSWAPISRKAEEISKALYELRGNAQKIDDGRFRVYEGTTPLCQRLPDDRDDMVKRIVITVMVEFMTNY